MAAIMPDAPAPSDIMSTFSGSKPANWDGSVSSHMHRNIGAQLPSIGMDPRKINITTTGQATRFTDDLPPPPYAFDVDMKSAARGVVLFRKYCASCHQSGGAEDQLFSPAETGTDANRANSSKPALVQGFRTVARAACAAPSCSATDEQIFTPTQKYRATNLAGIWSSAPYLHNGSVPTLHHLLVPKERPARFERGNTAYDTSNVGFVWNVRTADTVEYDVSLAGNSNGGHATTQFLGLDWSREPQKLADLLEYLKTL
jgi:hypothetical protein